MLGQNGRKANNNNYDLANLTPEQFHVFIFDPSQDVIFIADFKVTAAFFRLTNMCREALKIEA